jgi:hypothetical protein
MTPPIETVFFDSLFALIRRVVGSEAAMVSTDHFRQELRAQLGRAATAGHIDVLVNSGSYAARFITALPGQPLAAMPCKLSSSRAKRWFSTAPAERG